MHNERIDSITRYWLGEPLPTETVKKGRFELLRQACWGEKHQGIASKFSAGEYLNVAKHALGVLLVPCVRLYYNTRSLAGRVNLGKTSCRIKEIWEREQQVPEITYIRFGKDWSGEQIQTECP